MSQYSSRLHIRVSSPEVWRRFENKYDAGFDLASLADQGSNSFTCEGGNDWPCQEDEIEEIVRTLAETIGEDGAVFGDTANISIDPYNYCVFSLGDDVRVEFFDETIDREKMEMHFETDMSDIAGWLNYGGFAINAKEKEVLFKCGIAASLGKKAKFETFTTNFSIPDKVYLRETSFDGRPQIIEEISATQEVYFVRISREINVFLIEVMGPNGSLGYLPSEVGDQFAPLLLINRLKYSAFVEEVVPLSKRNKHAKSPIIAIGIKAEVSMTDVQVKNYVPKVSKGS